MRIHTEYMSFINHYVISRSIDFHVHQQCAQRRCCFSQNALSLALPGAPRHVISAPRLVVSDARIVVCTPRLVVGTPRLIVDAPRCSQVHPNFSLALRGVHKYITNTPMVPVYLLSTIPFTPKASRNALLGSDTLLKLTYLSLHITSS
jgi:hypothetical protein